LVKKTTLKEGEKEQLVKKNVYRFLLPSPAAEFFDLRI
jgi:hypothetical protein